MKVKRYELLDEERLCEESNLFSSDTGIDGYTFWISSRSGREKHQARIKIENSDGEVSISIWGEFKITAKRGKIRISGKDWKKITRFLELNRDTLLAHWNEEISSVEFGRRIKAI